MTLARPKSSTLTTALPSRPASDQVAGLDVAVDHAVLVRVLESQGRLMHVVAGMADRQRPLGLDDPGQVESLDVLHGQDEALAERRAE